MASEWTLMERLWMWLEIPVRGFEGIRTMPSGTWHVCRHGDPIAYGTGATLRLAIEDAENHCGQCTSAKIV